ncbi:hypothetical protein DFS34DRAFT_660448 [Phlyctochytrium arcticum]|nr:hypothetical protein DFS34DRAFT_660448 [Phlyctochytrium arcticum]
MIITAGTGVVVLPTPTGYSISSIDTFSQKKAVDDATETTEANAQDQVLRNGTGDIVSVTGGLSGILAGLSGGAGAVGTASSAIGAIGSASGLLGGAAAIGGFAAVAGRERKAKGTDINGNPLLDSNGNIDLQEGSQVVTVTLPDNGCDVTRLLFDKPPPCSWRGIENEFGQQSVNLEILREFNSEIIIPSTVSTISELIAPLQETVGINRAIISDIESNITNNYQPKITNENKLSYDFIQGTPNRSGYSTISNVASTFRTLH